jgi:hypothetical protein
METFNSSRSAIRVWGGAKRLGCIINLYHLSFAVTLVLGMVSHAAAQSRLINSNAILTPGVPTPLSALFSLELSASVPSWTVGIIFPCDGPPPYLEIVGDVPHSCPPAGSVAYSFVKGTDVYYGDQGLPPGGGEWSPFESGAVKVSSSFTGASITIDVVLQKQTLTGGQCGEYRCFIRTNEYIGPATFNLALTCEASTASRALNVLCQPAACKLTPIIIKDADAQSFEASAPNAPSFSLKPPYVEQQLYSRALDFIGSVAFLAPNLHIESGWRPLSYQEHFRDIRNGWVKYMTKLTPTEQLDCTEEFKKIENEIKLHGIKTCNPADGCNLLEGQPLVSHRSSHSGNLFGNPISTAVDIAPVGELNALGVLSIGYLDYGLSKPCPKDTVHFELGSSNVGNTGSCRTLSGIIDPPFNILITDPLGRKLGFDHVTNSTINEIGPEASYTGWNTELQFFDIGSIIPGTYAVQPVGIGSGPYSVELMQLNERSELLELQKFSGVTSPDVSFSPFVVSVPWEPTIDIKPNEFPNSISLKSAGKIPVALLSSAGFDARQVNASSLTFGRTGDENTLGFCNIEDVDRDGFQDLVCHFESRQTGFRSADTEGILKGRTLDGTPVISSDSVRIVR